MNGAIGYNYSTNENTNGPVPEFDDIKEIGRLKFMNKAYMANLGEPDFSIPIYLPFINYVRKMGFVTFMD